MAAVTICSDFGAQNNKLCYCFHCFPMYLPWSDGTRYHDLNVEFKTASSLSSFTFIKRLFSSSSLSAVRVGSSACLRLFAFLPAIYFSIIAFVACTLVSYLRHQRMSEFLTIRNYCQDWCQEGFPLCFLIEVLWFQVLLSL